MSLHYSIRLIPLLLLSVLLSSCGQPQRSLLDEVKREGRLTVLTRNAATTYYEGPSGPTGLEYDLMKGFADELGVKLRLIISPTVTDILLNLLDGDAHFAAAGLSITKSRSHLLNFTPPYQTISAQLIYRVGSTRPKDITQLEGHLEVIANSSHEEQLFQLKKQYPELTWVGNKETESEDLLNLVLEQVIDYTIADSNELAVNQRYYPELRTAFDLGQPHQLAWAFPKSQRDQSLFKAASDYFHRLKQSGQLDQLIERYYGHVDKFDYVGTRIYRRHIQQRLPTYQHLFKYAGEENGLDWRLLAAMAYQESHWNPKAVSPTGVRGMMMLTKKTARDLGVEKRTDPVESIRGGALYFKKLLAKVPERIPEPDRTWMALAAYNIGFGHLEDARIITQRRGGDADSWKDVKANLPLLRKRKWYKRTKKGYARGNEAVVYVENIRSYYDILVWQTEKTAPEEPKPHEALNILNPAL